MDVSVFLIVVPVVAIVVGSVVAVYYFAHKEKTERKKTKKLIQAYIMEKSKQHEAMNKELSNLDELLENKSIDKETYERLKNVLVMMNEKKGEGATDLLDYVTSKK